VENSSVQIVERSLKQLNDEEVSLMRGGKAGEAFGFWAKLGHGLSPDDDKNTRIENCFYSVRQEDFKGLDGIDGLVVDGPHGNGRFLAFILTADLLRENSLVLIDDFNHYPLLAECSRLFDYEEIQRSTLSGKAWVVLRVLKRRCASLVFKPVREPG
jgi:hypothetical protein